MDEVGLAGVLVPLQEEVAHPVLVGQGLDELVHLLLDPQAVVLAQTLQSSPSFLELDVVKSRLRDDLHLLLLLLLWENVQFVALHWVLLDDQGLDLGEQLPDGFVPEKSHVEELSKLLANEVFSISLIANGDDMLLSTDLLCQFIRLTDVEDDDFGEVLLGKETHEGIGLEFDQFTYEFVVFDVEMALCVSMAGEVKDGGTFVEGVLDVVLGGDHHLDPDAAAELLLRGWTSTRWIISTNWSYSTWKLTSFCVDRISSLGDPLWASRIRGSAKK